MTGVLLGCVVDRGDWFWVFVGSVVVAVDIGTWILLGSWMKAPTAKTADRPVAARAWKSAWLVTLLETYGG